MPRFQLLVREPGKEPRCVPIGDPIIVGRSRSVDLTVDDEEVGRKQFRIGVTSGFVVLEGLGATNPTRVDDRVIKAGEKTTLPTGAQIQVGNTRFTIESADTTEDRAPAPLDVVDKTMVAGAGPGGLPGVTPPAPPSPPADAAPMNTMEFRPPGIPSGGQPPAPPPAEPATEDAAPMNTMEFRPPGLAGAPGTPQPPVGDDTSTGGPPRPGQPPAEPVPPGPAPQGPAPQGPAPQGPAPQGEDFGQTMAKGFRPGAPGGVPPAKPKAGKPGPSKPMPGKPMPGKPTPPPPTAAIATPVPLGGTPATPKPPAPTPPTPKPPTSKPPAPKPPAAKQPAPTPPEPKPPAAEPIRPKTVAVRPEDMAPPPATTTASGDDLESLLHQSTPRLFVKGEGLKRPVRLMKARNKIGRAETADILLPHESVSEQHAEIRFDGKNWTLLDSGSTNGCVVDGQHLRGTEQIVRRNALIGIGSLHLIFLCIDKKTAATDRRDEDRALQQLTKSGRLDKATANEIRQMVRAESSHSIAEIVLRDTPIAPVEWANAVAAARRKVSFFTRILRLFTGGK